MLLISLSLFGLTACSDGGANTYDQITPQEAKTIMDTESDYIIIDARTTEEFAEGHEKRQYRQLGRGAGAGERTAKLHY